MFIKEAIMHARQVAEGCDAGNRDCAYQHDRLVDWLEELQAYRTLGTVDKLAELAGAGKDGRVVVLPCKACFSEAGNTVYLIYCGEIVEVVHCGLSICPSGNPYIALAADDKIFPYREGEAEHDTDPTDWCTNICDVAAEDFGKTVFLTRAEAEEAISVQRGDSHETDPV